MATVIDATGCVLGRLASVVAKRLLQGETIHIVNAEGALISGSRTRVFADYRQKREVGTRRKGPFFPRGPHMIVKRTVRGMLPHTEPRGKAAMGRLRVHISVPAELANQPTERPDNAQARTTAEFVTMGDVSRHLGAKV